MPEVQSNFDLGPFAGDALWQERCNLLWWARVNHRYHRKRQAFYDFYDQSTQAVSILAGVAIFSGKTLNDYAPLTGSIIVALSVLALAFGYSGRKLLHRDLSLKAGNLAAEIELCDINPPSAQLMDKWKRVRIDVCHTEPEPLPTLLEFCEWMTSREDGYIVGMKKPNLLQRMHMHFF